MRPLVEIRWRPYVVLHTDHCRRPSRDCTVRSDRERTHSAIFRCVNTRAWPKQHGRTLYVVLQLLFVVVVVVAILVLHVSIDSCVVYYHVPTSFAIIDKTV